MLSPTPRRASLLAAIATILLSSTAAAQQPDAATLSSQVEIRRTAYGVPHIKAQNLRAAYYALGYVQLEDHGPGIAMGLLRARGEYGRFFGRDSMESDFGAQREYALGVQNYPRLEQATRDVYEGFAAEPEPHLTARAQQAHGDAGTVVLELHVRERVVGRDEVLSPDVRNTVGGAPHLDLTGQIGRPWGLGRSGGIRAYRNGAQQNEQRNR